MANLNSSLCKKCKKCFEVKLLSDFYRGKLQKDGFRTKCKACENKAENEHRKKPEVILQRNRTRTARLAMPVKPGQKRKATEFSAEKKAEIYQRHLVWKAKNPDKYRDRKKKDHCRPLVKFQNGVRASIHKALNKKGFLKTSRTTQILGCDWIQFKEHIEKQFLSGMDWNLMGAKIHIDHITPISTAKTEDEVIALNHFTNLRPMWAVENLKKSNKITHLI